MHTLAPAESRDYSFPGQHKGERILLLLRRHWFVLFVTAVFFLFFMALPLIVWLFLPRGFLVTIDGSAWEGVLTLGLSAYYLFLWLLFFTAWVDYYLDVWIVTNERIIDIEQTGLFHRVISEQRLIRVQDVTSDVRGIFPTFLNFGNVFIQTAGERERFMFLQVPNPDGVKKVVLKAHEDAVTALPAGAQRTFAESGDVYGFPARPNFHPGHS